jgi:hypothetical protein
VIIESWRRRRAWTVHLSIALMLGCSGESIVSPVTPVLGVTTTSLSVSAPQGDSIVQSFSVTGDVPSVAWTASANVPWIVVSPASGTTPSTVAIVLKTAGLSVGNQSGIITITSSSSAAPVSVVVALTITAPLLTVSPTVLNFSGVAGSSSLSPQSVVIGTGGSATLQWTAAGSASWITVSPAAGSGPGTVSVGVNPSSLGIGTFQGLLTVSAPGAANSPQTIPVSVVLSGVTVAVAAAPAAAGAVTGGGTFVSGTSVTVVATPAAGFEFVDWRENGTPVSTSASYAFTAAANRTLLATFQPHMVSITTTSNPTNAGATAGGGSVQEGTSVTVSAAPDVAYAFSSWTENGTIVSTSMSYTFTATASRTLVANFTATGAGTVAITTSANPVFGGATSGDGAYAPGSTATVTATTYSGYVFTNWTVNGVVVSTNASYSFVVTTATQLVANYVDTSFSYIIGTSSNPVAGGTTTGGGTYTGGAPVTLQATANSGFTFVNWTDNGTAVAQTPTYGPFPASINKTLVANFAPVGSSSFTITTSSNPTIGGSTNGGGTYAAGTNATVRAFPGVGVFINWTENGAVVSTSPTYLFPVVANRTLVANFTNIGMTFVQPVNSQRVPDLLTIAARVTSQFQVASVTAAVGAIQVALAYNVSTSRWEGTMNIASTPHDTLTLSGTATDIHGSSVTTSMRFIHDLPPVLTVNAPTDFDVARPNLKYSVTCTDDDAAGCGTIELYAGNQLLASGSGSSFSGTVSLASYDGTTVAIQFRTMDSRNQQVTVTRSISVESSTQVDSLGATPGQLRDYRGGKALYAQAGQTGAPVALCALPACVPQPIAIPNATSASGFVTSTGAIGIAVIPGIGSPPLLYDWRNGVLATKSNVSYVEANSAYAQYFSIAVGGGLYRRELATGADVLVSSVAGNIANSVAENGDVAFWVGGNEYAVYRWRAGTATRLASDYPALWNTYPLTDGTNVVYRKHSPCCGTQSSQIMLHNGTNEIALTPIRAGLVIPLSDYAVNSGWTAYTLPDAGGSTQVWVRSPAGSLTQASIFGSSSQIEALGADGTVVFIVNGRRYLTTAGGTPRQIGGAGGSVVWRSGEFIWMIGRVVFRIR